MQLHPGIDRAKESEETRLYGGIVFSRISSTRKSKIEQVRMEYPVVNADSTTPNKRLVFTPLSGGFSHEQSARKPSPTDDDDVFQDSSDPS